HGAHGVYTEKLIALFTFKGLEFRKGFRRRIMKLGSALARATKLQLILAALSLILIGLTATFTRAQPANRGMGISDKQVKSLPSIGKRYAVAMGVDQYADTQITTLGGARNDTKPLVNAPID